MTWTTPDFILTRSGRRVGRSSMDVDLGDIRQGLLSCPRFAGHTRRPWSVLHHSLVCWKMCREGKGSSAIVQLLALLHDAHEAYTGDIPSPLKSPQMKALQNTMDVEIWRQLVNDAPPSMAARAIVKAIDLRALAAEAIEIGPPAVDESNVAELYGSLPSREDRKVVLDILRLDFMDAQSIFQRGCAALIVEVKRGVV